MAKAAVPGGVKTRLIPDLGVEGAAAVHAAMRRCVLDRLAALLGGGGDGSNDVHPPLLASTDPDLDRRDAVAPPGWRIVDQGEGDLGQRMARLWGGVARDVSGVHAGAPAPVAWFGVDIPDAPVAAMRDALAPIQPGRYRLGPVDDGGYWTLVAGSHQPGLLADIPWGTPDAERATAAAGDRLGLVREPLPAWHDVDDLADLHALRQRLVDRPPPPTGEATDPAGEAARADRAILDRLLTELDALLG